MIFNNEFILASSSNSRYKILKKNNLSFIRKKPICDEGFLKKKLIQQGSSIKKISLELARIKSKSVSGKNNNILVVGSDTVISQNGHLLNKAKNMGEARKKIISIAGKSHVIYSSASVFYNNKEVWHATLKSTIKIRSLSKKEIDSYLGVVGIKILSSVGCYHAEEMGPNIIENIKGDFYNVMGFPLFPFLTFVKKYKIKKQNEK